MNKYQNGNQCLLLPFWYEQATGQSFDEAADSIRKPGHFSIF